jgi:hypothetical protein
MYDLTRYKAEDLVITAEFESFIDQHYGLKAEDMATHDLRLMVDFYNRGASAAIMNRIVEIQEGRASESDTDGRFQQELPLEI